MLTAQHSPLRAQLYASQLLGAEARKQGHATEGHISKREVDCHSTYLLSLSNPTSKSQPLTFGEIDNDSELKVNEKGVFEFISELFRGITFHFMKQVNFLLKAGG